VSPPPVATARPEVVAEELPRRRQAWIERATSTDHKSVGTLYIGAALAFLVAAVAQLVVMRTQLIVPENTLTDPEIFNRIMSTFAVTGVETAPSVQSQDAPVEQTGYFTNLLGDREEALDLSQEVFLRVFRTLHRFRGQSSLRTWIYRIAVNQARNKHRFWRRRQRWRCA